MRTRLLAMLLAALGCTLALAGRSIGPTAMAQPAATPTTIAPRLPVPPSVVTLDRLNLTVDIADQIAVTTLDLDFTNPTDRPQEATLLLPVPTDASVSDFTMTVDGQTLEGEILDREAAAAIYAAIVRSRRDPALLEHAGQNLLRARVFPVPPRGESRLTVRFSQVLVPENGAIRYRLPLFATAEAVQPLARLAITARVQHRQGVRALFSPTHDLRFERQRETMMTGSLVQQHVAARGTFELNALLSGDPVAAGMITYRVPGADGFFMLWLAPPIQAENVVAKDVILVLDVSGSMTGQKLEQAKAALRFVLNRLNPEDRFNIIAFSTGVDRYSASLLPAAQAGAAIAYVNRLRAEGSTNINEALLTAVRGTDPERFTTILFLTDGEPTVGERTPARIMDNVREAMPTTARLFVFGVGHDVNTVLLDGLATENHGDVAYVRPEEDVEEAVSALYARISAPQLTGVRLDMGDALIYDLYPQPLPDLFAGQTLFVLGRYRSSGTVHVRLDGSTREGPRTYAFPPMQMPENERGASYLPRLWASRKVGYLLREIRLRGPHTSQELIDEVVALATRYGIVTPYTSYLVQEAPLSPQAAARAVATAAAAPVSGAAATGASAQTGSLIAATPAPVLPRPTPAATLGPGQSQPSSPAAITYVGDKSFVQRNGVWTDTTYQPGTETVQVTFATNAYFELLAQQPELAPYFALGTRVIVVLGGVAYEVTE